MHRHLLGDASPDALTDKQGAPRNLICKPCRAVSGGFRDPPADYVTELSAKKADGRDRLVNTCIPPRALPNKDRDMLVAFPSPILASSSSSFYAFSCQKPKI